MYFHTYLLGEQKKNKVKKKINDASYSPER